MTDAPQYKPGDIANGHRLTQQPDGSLVWLPVDATPGPAKPKWYTRKWVQIAGVGVLAFALGSAVGASGGSNDDEIGALQTDLRVAESELAAAEADRDGLLGLLEGWEAREDDIAAREQAITDREAAVTEAEIVKAAQTMTTGAGYVVGVSIEPGVYRTTTSTTSCYWAIYTSGTNREDIVANDFGTAGTIDVTLAAGQDFVSNECGEWTKVG